MRLNRQHSWILISCIFAITIVAGIVSFVGALYRAPDHISLGGSPSCPTNAISSGVRDILADPLQREQAIKILLWAETPNSVDKLPPATFDNILRWVRQRNLMSTLTRQELAGLLCQGPIINVDGKRLAGVASVAIEHLDKSIDQVTPKEAFLFACAVIGANPKARNLLKLPSPTTPDNIEEFCPGYGENRSE